jgi:GDP-D-mannose dehydratase
LYDSKAFSSAKTATNFSDAQEHGLVWIKLGLQYCLYLGSLDVGRDWDHARDFIEMQRIWSRRFGQLRRGSR